MDRRFFRRLGASELDRTICSAAGEAGLLSVLGMKLGTELSSSSTPATSSPGLRTFTGNNVHSGPSSPRRGATARKLVVIDPYRTRTAACADWYLPINPGTMALSLSP